jgi:hypothetical protein
MTMVSASELEQKIALTDAVEERRLAIGSALKVISAFGTWVWSTSPPLKMESARSGSRSSFASSGRD